MIKSGFTKTPLVVSWEMYWKAARLGTRRLWHATLTSLRTRALILPPAGRVGGRWLSAEVHSGNCPWTKVMPPWGEVGWGAAHIHCGWGEEGLLWMVEVEKSGNVLV